MLTILELASSFGNFLKLLSTKTSIFLKLFLVDVWCKSPSCSNTCHKRLYNSPFSRSLRVMSVTDEFESHQRDQSTLSVTKWANGHWHAVFRIWLPRHAVQVFKSIRCTALIHPFASELSGGASLLLSTSVLQRERECGRYGSQSRGFNKVCADSHTRSVRWPTPLHASALKEQFL